MHIYICIYNIYIYIYIYIYISNIYIYIYIYICRNENYLDISPLGFNTK